MDRLLSVAVSTRRWLVVALVVEAVLLAGMLHARGPFDHAGMDFLTTWTGASMIADGAATDLYDTRVQWEYQRPVIERYDVAWPDRVMHPYVAPPLLAAAALPLLTVPPAVAFAIWATLNAAAIAAAVWLLCRSAGVDWRWGAAVLAGSMPVFCILLLGQVEGFLLLAFVGFVVGLRSGHDVRAGLALSLLALKPQLLLAPLIYLAACRRPRAFTAAVASTALQALFALALVGTQGVRDSVSLSRRLSGPEGTVVTNVEGMVNLRAIVVRALSPDGSLLISVLIVALTGAMLAASVWFLRRAGARGDELPALALLALTTVVTAYHALYHTASLALLGVALLVLHWHTVGEERRASALTTCSWIWFTLAPLLYFLTAQSTKIPAMLGTIAVVLAWAMAAQAVIQPIPLPAGRLQTARALTGERSAPREA